MLNLHRWRTEENKRIENKKPIWDILRMYKYSLKGTSRIVSYKRVIELQQSLLDTVAHDIKNPLQVLKFAIQILKSAPKNHSQTLDKVIPVLESSTHGIQTVIKQLVNERWERDSHTLFVEDVDIKEVLEDVLYTLNHQIVEREAEFNIEIVSGNITIVRRMLRSILFNLINNSLKFTPYNRKPIIKIKSYQILGYSVVEIEDNGIGISTENQSLIFKKFHRITNDEIGNGVGLYLVDTLMKQCDGKIEFDSKENEGSKFKLFFKSI